MSWALEAIEKAALERAQKTLLQDSTIRVMGLSMPQIAAFVHFFRSNESTGRGPEEFEPQQIMQKLRQWTL